MNADFSDIYEKATDYIEIDLPEGVEFLVVDDFSTGEHLTLAAIIEDNEIMAQSVIRIIDEDGYCKIACANRGRKNCTDPKFVTYNNIPREDAWYFIATSLTKQ